MFTIVFGRAAQFLLTLAMMRVATSLLSPREMGRVSLIVATTTFFALFLVNPVGMFVNRRLHAWQDSGVARHHLIQYAFYLIVASVVAALGVALLYLSGLADFGISVVCLCALVFGSLLAAAINQTAIPSLNLLGDSSRFVLLTVGTITASFACATLLVTLAQPLAQYWSLGLLIGQAILGLVGGHVLFARLRRMGIAPGSRLMTRQNLSTLFSYAWPVTLAAGFGWVQVQGYRYLMEGRLGLASLGLFVAGYGISSGILAGLESVLTAYFQPRLYRDVSAASSADIAKAWRRYAASVIPSMLLTVMVIAVLAPELTRIFLGVNFQPAAKYVVWGALAEAARVLMAVYSLIAHVHMRTRWLILPNFIGAFLSMILCALLIPHLGATGVGVGLAISGFIVVLITRQILAKHVGEGAPSRPIIVAVISGATLWAATWGLRHFTGTGGWASFISSLTLVGIAYLGLVYLFLRQYI